MDATSSEATDDAHAAGPRPGAAVRVVRARVPGRARLSVAGLRRDPALKRRLEEALPGRAGIHHARANPGTGNLLVLFEATRSLAAVVAAVEAVRAGGAPPSQTDAGADHEPAGGASRPDTAGDGADGSGDWHRLALDTIAARFGTPLDTGLADAQAARALAAHGRNEFPRVEPRADARILADQVTNIPTGVLAASAALSAATGGVVDGVAILSVVAANAAIGFATERRAERTIDALSRLEETEATVLRGGASRRIAAAEVVPGDILELAPGMMVAADGRLIAARELTVDEAALTGEALPAAKRAGELDADTTGEVPLADRANMVHKGTAVTGGTGRALAVATGADTEVGRIQTLVGHAERRATPMQVELDRLGRQLTVLTLGAAGLALVAGLLRGRPPLDMLKTAVSLGVAALPEGLPTISTVTLALGMSTMRRRKVLVRRLDAIEALGSVGVIAFDKTGTLTENRIAARTVATPARDYDVAADGFVNGFGDGAGGAFDGSGEAPDADLYGLLRVAVLCNETEIDGEGDGRRLRGSSTEAALIALAERAGLDVVALKARHPRRTVEYRTLDRRYMTTTHRLGDGRVLVAVKGNPLDVAARCETVAAGGNRSPLGRRERTAIETQNSDLASRGLRILGFASAVVDEGAADAPPEELTWHGMVGLSDPTRQGMPALMAEFHRAGIRTVMITGDQSATAYAVARELNLAQDGTIEVLEGVDLEKMDPEMLAGLARHSHAFARVTPANKLQIVRALQQDGTVIAMTGDGINDSPALRVADIGVAMGSGSEAAHQVAEVILADDRIEGMAAAIELGRQTHDNIRRSLRFLLSTNVSEVLVTTLTSALGGQPMTPLQLLWINLVTDVFPALALGLEPAAPDVLDRPPRDPDAPLLGRDDLRRTALNAGTFSLVALVAQGLGALRHGPGGDAAMAFTTLTLSQLLHAVSSRSDRLPATRYGDLKPNPYVRRSVGGLLGLQLAVSAFPPTRKLLGLQRLGVVDLVAAGGLALGSFAAVEGLKMLNRDQEERR